MMPSWLPWLLVFAVLLQSRAGLRLDAAPAPAQPYSQPLVVGSELDYPPFALVGPDQQAEGFTVELWRAVEREAGLSSQVKVGPFHSILEEFKAGKIDVMINLAQSEERAEFCSFAVPHVTMHGAIFVRKGERTVASEADLPGRSLIVLNGDLAHDYAIQQGWTNHLVLVDDTAAGLRLLASGRHDAMLVGKLVGLNSLSQHGIRNVRPLPGRIDFHQKFAFAVMKNRPKSPELLARINEGLALVKANGTYDALYEKWFGVLEPRKISIAQVLKFLIPALLLAALALGAYGVERRLRLRSKQSLSLLNATLESTADGILAVGSDGRVTAFNRKLASFGFWPPGSGVGGSGSSEAIFGALLARLPDRDGFERTLAAIRQRPDMESFDTLRLDDGCCLEVVSKALKSEGTDPGRVWSFRDVTRREQAADEIRRFNLELEERVRERTRQLEEAGRSVERLSHVASRTRNSVLICDADLRIDWVNEGFERTSGWKLAEVVGRRPRDLLKGPDTDPQVLDQIDKALRERRPIQFTLQICTKAGTPYWVEADINPVFDREGRLISFVSVQADVTERREAAERLRRQSEKLAETNANLEQALRFRDSFLAAMSHELRTPLHGILSVSELLLEELFGPLNPKQQGYLMRIQESGNHLLELINDVLDLAKIQAGGLALERVDCGVREICAASLQLVEDAAKHKAHQLTISIEPEDLRVLADARRLKQILVNLLGNAIKFTPPGGRIELNVRPFGHELHLVVSDSGIGIPQDQIERLFQPFVQLDNRLSRDYSGTGLGLALVRQIVDAHGGRVEVRSRVGEGSSFLVVLPWQPVAEAGQGAPDQSAGVQPGVTPAPLLSGLRVLVAEDNALSMLTMRSFLEGRGATVLAAENGRQAVQLAENNEPDLVLMDIQMGGMDGLEATARIRQLPDAARRQVPIVALTALAMPGDRERCLAAGADAYITKPVLLRDLAVTINQMVGRPPGARRGGPQPVATTA